MDNLPYGSDSGYSLFEKIRFRLSGLPTYVWVFLLVLSSAVIIGATYIFLSPNISLKDLFKGKEKVEVNGEKNISTTYKPSPRPLASGKQTYLVSGSKTGAPKATEVVIDPLDPAQNASQTVTVKVISLDGTPVSEVEVNMITDNKEKTYPLKLVSGTNLDGSWQGTWTLEDSYDYLYQAAIKAKNAKSEWTVTLSFR